MPLVESGPSLGGKDSHRESKRKPYLREERKIEICPGRFAFKDHPRSGVFFPAMSWTSRKGRKAGKGEIRTKQMTIC